MQKLYYGVVGWFDDNRSRIGWGGIGLIAAVLIVLVVVGLMPKKARAEGLSPPIPGIGAITNPASGSWSGVYVGAHAGYGVAVGEISQHGDSIRGLSADGMIGGVHGGFDYQFPSSIWVVGVRGAYTWSNMEFTAGGLNVGVDDGWSVDGRVGIAAGNALPYVFGGYTRVKTSNNAGVNSPELEGWRAGTGVEWKIPGAQFVTVGLDYAYTKYEGVSVGEYCPIDIDPEDHRVTARVNFRFGGK